MGRMKAFVTSIGHSTVSNSILRRLRGQRMRTSSSTNSSISFGNPELRMIMRQHYQKILVLGSGALKIGEAGEFDYSGSQAIKALKDEGITTILVNPNIATIQTSDRLADEIYFLPVNAHFVTQVIEKERPDGIMISFGGQTALNCGLELDERGVFRDFGVEVLGTPIQAVRVTEDLQLFARRLNEINIQIPRSAAAVSADEATEIAHSIGYPVML